METLTQGTTQQRHAEYQILWTPYAPFLFPYVLFSSTSPLTSHLVSLPCKGCRCCCCCCYCCCGIGFPRPPFLPLDSLCSFLPLPPQTLRCSTLPWWPQKNCPPAPCPSVKSVVPLTLLSVHCSVTHQLWRCLHSAGLREWVCVQGNLSCLVLIYNPSAICRHACLPLPDHDGLSDRRRGEEKQERWRRNTNLIGQANIDGADPVWAPKQLSQGDNWEAHLDCDASKRMLHTVAHPCEKRQMVCSACVDAARSYSPLIRNTR